MHWPLKWAKNGRIPNLPLREAQKLQEEFASPLERAVLNYELGVTYSLLTDDVYDGLERSLACLEEALQDIDPEADIELYLEVLNIQGSVYARFGHAKHEYFQRAMLCYKEILQVAEAARLSETRARALLNLGTLWSNLPAGDKEVNLDMARRYLEEAIDLNTNVHYPSVRMYHSMAWANLARVYLDLSELRENDRDFLLQRALFHAKAAIKGFGVSGNSWDGASMEMYLGVIYTDL